MNFSISEQITVSERISLMILPALYQKDLGIVSGNVYRLTFDSVITSGVLKVYQGSQLIYSSDAVFLGVANYLYDIAHVTERVRVDIQNKVNLSDSITVSENISLSIPVLVNEYESVTITENFARA